MCNLQRGKLDTNFLVLSYLTGYILHYMTIHNLCIIWFLCPFCLHLEEKHIFMTGREH